MSIGDTACVLALPLPPEELSKNYFNLAPSPGPVMIPRGLPPPPGMGPPRLPPGRILNKHFKNQYSVLSNFLQLKL